MDYLTTHTSLSPIPHGFAPGWYKPITNTAWVRARLCKLIQAYHQYGVGSHPAL